MDLLSDQFLTCSRIPAWKHLVDRPHTADERVSLITVIFSDPNETEVVKGLCGDDAQSFIDVIDQVSLVLSLERNETIDLHPNFSVSLNRRWTS